MYTVTMEKQCACFLKSEYNRVEKFNTQSEAYKYTNMVMEMMNEDFCQFHMFYGEQTDTKEFIIRVALNTGEGDSCGIDEEDSSNGCGTSCGC